MSLPIHSVLPLLADALVQRDEAILVAAPGAGKTTQVPLALLQAPWLGEQRILLLEPRRLAARTAAQRMAELLGEKPGETVGYRMRLDSKESSATRILVVTEGVLTRMLHSDPSLEGYGLLIFDEYHERSLDADLGLALSLYARSLFRHEARPESPGLKLLLMSATLDSESLSALLGQAPVIRSEGRSFPVDIRYVETPQLHHLIDEMATTVCESLAGDSGSLLVFLPGQAEIRALARSLEHRVPANVVLAPLYGDMDLASQRRAIEPAQAGCRKVVLATNVAESSLTIDGVNIVIDSGFSRAPQFDPRTGMTRLHTVRVSRASADQRAGRAGRLAPGIAYRMWSESQTLVPFSEPEIAQADLAPLALQLLQWGVRPAELVWLDAPRNAPYQQALDLLHRLGACTDPAIEAARITAHGEAMAALPVHPRLAHMLLRSRAWGAHQLACDLAAILAERDPAPDAGADIAVRIRLLANGSSKQSVLKRLRQQSRQYLRLLDVTSPSNTRHAALEGLLLALAYPDRIARQRASGSEQYLLANGRSASLRDDDPLRNKPWLAIAQLGGRAGQSQDRIYMAAEFDPAWLDTELSDMVSVHDIAEWQHDGKLLLETQLRLGRLVIKREPAINVDEQVSQRAVVGWLQENGLADLPWDESLRQWQQRILCLRGQFGDDSEWPDVSDDWLKHNLEQWLMPFLPAITHRRQLKKLDLKAALHSLLPWPLPQQLDELAPTHIKVPSGSNIALDYLHSPPVLAVKLQEMFGQKTTPAIAGGRLPLVLHLLSPARRPLQVTQDLESFWQNGYADVKRELKGRYPKHPWPDDPMSAAPRRGTKKQGA